LLLKSIKVFIERNNSSINAFAGMLSLEVFIRALSFLLIPVYTRLHTNAEFGNVAYLLGLANSLSVVFTFGLYVSIVKVSRQSCESEVNSKQYLVSNLLLQGLFFLSLFVIFWLFFGETQYLKLIFDNLPSTFTLNCFFSMILTSAFFLQISAYLQANDNFKSLTKYSATRFLVSSIFSCLAITCFRDAKVEARVFTVAAVDWVILCFFATSRKIFSGNSLIQKIAQARVLILSQLTTAVPVFFSAVIGLVVNFFDKFALEKTIKPEALSNYMLATSLASILPAFFAPFNSLIFPKIMSQNPKDCAHIFKRGALLSLVVVCVSLFVYCLVSAVFFLDLLPSQYSESMSYLPILLCSTFCAIVSGFYGHFLVLFGKGYYSPFIGALAAVIVGSFGFQFIRTFGITGAALLNLLPNLLYLLLHFFISLRFLNKFKYEG
jgi:O-antigen/teichoic acid export membrane protein